MKSSLLKKIMVVAAVTGMTVSASAFGYYQWCAPKCVVIFNGQYCEKWIEPYGECNFYLFDYCAVNGTTTSPVDVVHQGTVNGSCPGCTQGNWGPPVDTYTVTDYCF